MTNYLFSPTWLISPQLCGSSSLFLQGVNGASSQHLIYSLATCVFFRKSFCLNTNKAQLGCLTAAALLISTDNGRLRVLCLLASLSFLYLLNRWERLKSRTSFIEHTIGFPNADIQDAFNILAVYFYLSICSIILSMKAWETVPVLALFQVIRNPTSLKDSLRFLRVALGPVSVVNAIMIGIHSVGNSDYSLSEQILGVVCATTALVGGVIFRPDNSEVLRLIIQNPSQMPSYKRMLTLHGYLNMSAVLFASIVYVIRKFGTL